MKFDLDGIFFLRLAKMSFKQHATKTQTLPYHENITIFKRVILIARQCQYKGDLNARKPTWYILNGTGCE